MKIVYIFTLLISFSVSQNVLAQTDSLIFKTGTYMVGEAKSMDRNVLTFKTKYSDSDFKIEWNGVAEIYTDTYFLITLTDGSRYNGTLKSIEAGKIVIITGDGQEVETLHDDIVFLDDKDQGFWSQLYFSVDIGFDMTKANNLSTFTTRSTLGFISERWNIDSHFNTLYSSQDAVEDIKRTDGGIGYKFFLPRDWYPLISFDFLSNTEQKLDLRTSWKVGMGKYVLHTNSAYWGFSLGANNNNENFSDETPDRNSWEGFLGTELNLFNIGDLNLSTKLIAYPSFTESGRMRTDFNFDVKYEMPFDDDFYIKIGTTVNYDNRPIEGASEMDYVFHTGVGWQW